MGQDLPLVKVSAQYAIYFFSNCTLKKYKYLSIYANFRSIVQTWYRKHWQPAVAIMVDYFVESFCTEEVLKLRKNYCKYQTIF